MEVLNIIFAVLLVCVMILAVALIICLIIRHTKLSKVKNYDDLNKALSYGTKLLNITIVVALLGIGVGMLSLAFGVHPPMSAMQITGIVLSAFWFLAAVVFIFLIRKKK
ncbi:MAG: hypothetical protein E7016_01805 [Alphaproteobacteria bacterium]|nr:hypothetical protein [Alphaproteobacteria bacterium]